MAGICQHSLELTGLVGDRESRAHRLDPRAKIVGLVAIIVVAVSTPLDQWPVYVGCALVLATFARVGRVPPGDIWRRARVVLPLVLLVAVFVPFLRPGGAAYALGPITVHEAGLVVLGTVAAKATLAILSAVLLGATTSFPEVLRGLEAMRVPRVLVLIASFMYRYLFVIVEEVGRMRAALAARAYRPRHVLQAGPMGRVASSMFLRTHARGERVYLAMLARGYSGRMPQLDALAFGRADAAFVAIVLVALLPLRVTSAIVA